MNLSLKNKNSLFFIEKCILSEDILIKNENVIEFENYEDLEKSFNKIFDSKNSEMNFLIFCGMRTVKKILLKNHSLKKGLIYNPKYFEHSFYSQYLDRESLLNKEFILLPYGNLFYLKNKIFEFFGSDKLFIKPNKNDKSCESFVVSLDDFDHKINVLKSVYKIYDEEIFFITSYKVINGPEKRFWICEGEIISETFYMVGDYNLNEKINEYKNVFESKDFIHGFVLNSIEKFLNIESWLTVDICFYKNEFKIVELNAFSTSGFYDGINYDDFFKKINNFLT